jgi:hypothetical protein
VAELKMLKEKYAFDHIWFCDDIFGLKPGWVHEFAGLVEKEQLNFTFKIQARADSVITGRLYPGPCKGRLRKYLDGR